MIQIEAPSTFALLCLHLQQFGRAHAAYLNLEIPGQDAPDTAFQDLIRAEQLLQRLNEQIEVSATTLFEDPTATITVY